MFKRDGYEKENSNKFYIHDIFSFCIYEVMAFSRADGD